MFSVNPRLQLPVSPRCVDASLVRASECRIYKLTEVPLSNHHHNFHQSSPMAAQRNTKTPLPGLGSHTESFITELNRFIVQELRA